MSSHLPVGIITISTYQQLRHHLNAFSTGRYSFIILIGSPGLGKTRAIRQVMSEQPHALIDNHATAFGLYAACYEHRDEPVILDDLDHLYRDPNCVRLLKALCNTEETKTLRWVSKHPMIGDQPGQIPSEFSTRSTVCLLANEWKTANDNVRAVEDRAILLRFAPNADELHSEVGRWYQNLTVYEFMGKHRCLIETPSIRHYIRGDQLYQANPNDWQSLLLESLGIDERLRTIVQLTDDSSIESEEGRARRFSSAGLGSRANYFRWKKRLRLSNQQQNDSLRVAAGVYLINLRRCLIGMQFTPW